MTNVTPEYVAEIIQKFEVADENKQKGVMGIEGNSMSHSFTLSFLYLKHPFVSQSKSWFLRLKPAYKSPNSGLEKESLTCFISVRRSGNSNVWNKIFRYVEINTNSMFILPPDLHLWQNPNLEDCVFQWAAHFIEGWALGRSRADWVRMWAAGKRKIWQKWEEWVQREEEESWG